MSAKRRIDFWAQIVLGLLLVVTGSNKFLQFMPNPDMPQEAASFMGALVASGYMMPFIGITELGVGVLLLARLWSALALLVLAPLTLNIMLFHLFLAPSSIAMGLAVAVLNVYLLFVYLPKYRPLLSPR